MTQARNATTEDEWKAALEACHQFDHELWIRALHLAGHEGSWSLHRNNINGKVYDGPYLRGYNPDAPMFEKYRRTWQDVRAWSLEQIYAFLFENRTWTMWTVDAGNFMCDSESGRFKDEEDSDNGF